MPTSFSLFSSLLLLGGIQGILLSIFLIFGKTLQTQSNRPLGLLLLLFSFNIIIPELVKNYPGTFAHLIGASFPLVFLFGPLLLVYAGNLVERTKILTWKLIASVIPFFLSVIYLLPFYSLDSHSKLEFYNSIRNNGLPVDFIFLWGLGCLHVSIYSFFVFMLIKSYQEKIKNECSEISKITLVWLRNLAAGFSFVWIIYLFFFLIFALGLAVDPFGMSDYYFGLILSILIYSIGYKGWKQPGIFHGFDSDEKKLNGIKKYAKSGLTEDKAKEYLNILTIFMDKEKFYKNPDVTLKDVANSIEIHPNALSQIINDKLNQNFYDFINTYRVKEAKKLLVSDSNLNIIEIAFESGFKSKSTFNTAFKKHTGLTPTEFRKTNFSKKN